MHPHHVNGQLGDGYVTGGQLFFIITDDAGLRPRFHHI